MKSSIWISSIEIHNTYGTKHIKFPLSSCTRIKGSNGLGKSSILRALSYVFEGGLDPSVIRKGTDKSIVEMVLDTGVVIRKTTAVMKPRKNGDPNEAPRYKAELEITDADGLPIPAPKRFLDELSEALAVDPSILLRIDATTMPGRKALAAELLKLVPIEFAPAEVNRAVSIRSSVDVPFHEPDAIALPQSLEVPLDLDGLKKTITQITEMRRRVGQTRDDSDGAVNRLQQSLPADGDAAVDHGAALKALEQESLEIERAIGDRRVEIEGMKTAALAEADRKFSVADRAAEEEYNAAVAILREKRDAAIQQAKQVQGSTREQILSATASELTALEAEAKPEQQRVAGEIATVKERMAQHHRAATLRQEIDIQLATCRAAHWKYDELTRALERLEALRLEKLDNLPVAGLVIENGSAYIDGVEWQNVNTARRVEAVLQICTQRSGKLPFILLDDGEHLDKETRRMLEEGLAEAGYQLVEAIVSDGPLTIETVESPVMA